MAQRKVAPTHLDFQTTVPPQSGTYPNTRLGTVLTRPHPLLEQRSVDVDPQHPTIIALAHILVATMRTSPACTGLAAPQIGRPVRLFCMDVSGHKKARSCAGLVVLANPMIVTQSGEIKMREGCMSVPHLTGNVVRAAEVVVEGAIPGSGKIVRVSANAMEARCIQHEIDHLDGFVFVQRIADSSTDLFERKMYA